MLLKTTRVLFVIFRGLLMRCFAAPRGVSLRQSLFVSLVFPYFCQGAQFNGSRINRNIPSIIRNCSMKRDLHEISLSIFQLVLRYGIDLQVDWIPSSLNEHADAISRIVDFDDWGVSFEFFHHVDNIWGPHSVDRFVHSHNRKLPRFFSRFWNPDSEGVDAFVLTGRGRITGSLPQCPLFLGLLGICLCVGLWARLLSRNGSQLLFGPCSLVPILPFPSALRRPLFIPMFPIFLVRALQSRFLMAPNLSLMY